jgi:hypothetical protein
MAILIYTLGTLCYVLQDSVLWWLKRISHLVTRNVVTEVFDHARCHCTQVASVDAHLISEA